MKIVSLFLLLMSLSSFLLIGVAAEPDPSADAPALKIMSFNIRYGTANDGENRWEKRKFIVFDVLRRQDADVVGLQEALRFQLDEIKEQFPGYAELGVGRNDGEGGEYSAILYRADRFTVKASGTFWLSDTPDRPSAHWGNTLNRICTWARLKDRVAEGSVYVYNTHLDHQSQSSREKSVGLIVQHIAAHKTPAPFVLMGDFNAGESNPAIRYLKGRSEEAPIRVVDTFRVRHPDAREVGTFNGFIGRSDRDKIDYVFVEPGTKVLEAEIIRTNESGRYPSDHYPVSAIVRF